MTEALRLLNQQADSLTTQHAIAVAQQAQQEAEAQALKAQREALDRALQEAEAQRRRAEAQRFKAEQEAAQAKIKAANTFSAFGTIAVTSPLIIGAAGIVAEAETAALALATALRAGIAELIGVAAAGPGALISTFATLALYSPRLATLSVLSSAFHCQRLTLMLR